MDLSKYVNHAKLDEKKTWREREQELSAQFKKDLFEELEIENNPRREKLFEIAWSHGHGSGYSDVYYLACELADLIT